MSRGRFVVFEGIDASGKSTQARRVADERAARFTFEPGDTPLGVDLRRWLLDASAPMSPVTESLLMLADRSHHAATVIEPTLAAGDSVVSDRYWASSIAYQGYGRGVDLALLRAATELAIGACQPDVTILLDIPVEVADERRLRDHRDRFESADVAFHERVRAGYLELAAADPAHWRIIDGAGDYETVSVAIEAVLAEIGWPGG